MKAIKRLLTVIALCITSVHLLKAKDSLPGFNKEENAKRCLKFLQALDTNEWRNPRTVTLPTIYKL